MPASCRGRLLGSVCGVPLGYPSHLGKPRASDRPRQFKGLQPKGVLMTPKQLRRATFEEIVATLPRLTASQRQDIAQWCQAVPVSKKKIYMKPLDADDWFADAVGEYLVKKGMATKDDVRVLLTIAAHHLDDYHRESKSMRDDLGSLVDVDDRTSQLFFGRVVVKALVNMMRDKRLPYYLLEKLDYYRVPPEIITEINNQFAKRPIDADLLMANVSHVRAALEHELPGYIVSGMLPLVKPR